MISRIKLDETHGDPCDIQVVRLGEFGSFDGAANAGKHTAGHEQAEGDALFEAQVEVPEDGDGDEGEAEVDEDVPAWEVVLVIPFSCGKNSLFGYVLELKIVTSVIMTGFQQLAVMVKSHRAAEGVHAVKRRIEFNALMKSVENMMNHKIRVRQ